ncbi:MAG: energy transducer TonB [Methylicorpusculum sp.]|uniref:energy transducer TonB n=1 Tax=Methylicorpusculum sp. TaxID=2713644 RepID=UPI0027274E33|nr:energy transducer TonB [Methylicorpusculum sp.]MDO8844706.1 energy transducer TonB [Methylicorpusculum sp.]MDO8938717.1 energy transducer TonB [Methylicorpusculum sp.]MDO9239081.1 energy transducer TonB [Methylicorpusculum sp.]MDP2178987.1 energy transducer TonB [Methylicorpusculum sp.]MDP2201189.1 energy transducer TonB [Methylicorpusculum sp.]
MKRLIVSSIIGSLVTFGLFWLMQAMVMDNSHNLKPTDNLQMVEFIRLKKEHQPDVHERKPIRKPPPPPEKRPPPPKMQMQQTQVQPVTQPNLAVPKLDIPIDTTQFNQSVVAGLTVAAETAPATVSAPAAAQGPKTSEGVPEGTGTISTDVIPLVRIPPAYPQRAASRRIEGWVKIEFTITTTGTVTDAVVVDSKPAAMFDRAALDAIKKWKFKAKIVEGKAVEQRALQILQFKLSK